MDDAAVAVDDAGSEVAGSEAPSEVPQAAAPAPVADNGEVLARIDNSTSSIDAAMSEGFANVNSRLDAIGNDQARLMLDIENATIGGEERNANETETNATVTISPAQWSQLESNWDALQASSAVSLFLTLVCTLLVAAVFGSRLWDAFSKGWRR